MLGKARKEPVC